MTGILPVAAWMTEPATAAVFAALGRAGIDARFVGGCVRDHLAGRQIGDIDIAAAAPPESVSSAAERAGLSVVPTGIDHGTVTVIADHQPFQITSLRSDLMTDGRHAIVAYTDDWQQDAARRDFTINAMSLSPDGRLSDYFGGQADLAAGVVRFVGDPDRRIAEDRLRLLRFYRIFAHFGRGPMDAAAVAAAGQAAPGLVALSAERVRAETLKLLAAADPVPAWCGLIDCGAVAVLYPALTDLKRLAALASADPLLRLAALATGDAAVDLAARLRLSGAEAGRLATALAPGEMETEADPERLRHALYRWGAQGARDRLLLAAAALGRDPGPALPLLDQMTPPVLPLRGRDLRALGVAEGAEIGWLLAEVEAWWVAEAFRPDHAACLAQARRLRASQRG